MVFVAQRTGDVRLRDVDGRCGAVRSVSTDLRTAHLHREGVDRLMGCQRRDRAASEGYGSTLDLRVRDAVPGDGRRMRGEVGEGYRFQVPVGGGHVRDMVRVNDLVLPIASIVHEGIPHGGKVNTRRTAAVGDPTGAYPAVGVEVSVQMPSLVYLIPGHDGVSTHQLELQGFNRRTGEQGVDGVDAHREVGEALAEAQDGGLDVADGICQRKDRLGFRPRNIDIRIAVAIELDGVVAATLGVSYHDAAYRRRGGRRDVARCDLRVLGRRDRTAVRQAPPHRFERDPRSTAARRHSPSGDEAVRHEAFDGRAVAAAGVELQVVVSLLVGVQEVVDAEP